MPVPLLQLFAHCISKPLQRLAVVEKGSQSTKIALFSVHCLKTKENMKVLHLYVLIEATIGLQYTCRLTRVQNAIDLCL